MIPVKQVRRMRTAQANELFRKCKVIKNTDKRAQYLENNKHLRVAFVSREIDPIEVVQREHVPPGHDNEGIVRVILVVFQVADDQQGGGYERHEPVHAENYLLPDRCEGRESHIQLEHCVDGQPQPKVEPDVLEPLLVESSSLPL